MRRLALFALAVSLVLLQASPASAGYPAFAQIVCGSASTLAFASAPPANDIVSGLVYTNVSPPSSTLITDSNATALTQQSGATAGAGPYASLYDYLSPGTETKTFSYSSTPPGCLYDMIGATLTATYTKAFNTGVSPLSLTLSGVKAGDFVVCLAADVNNTFTGSLSTTNGTVTNDLNGSGFNNTNGHFVATRTASTTVSISIVNAADGDVIICGDYTVIIGGLYSPWPWLGPILSQ